MKSKIDHQAATNEEGKIRVTGKKKRFSFFKKTDEPAVDVLYPEESLKGRNPREAAGKKQQPQRQSAAPRPSQPNAQPRSPQTNRSAGPGNRRATWAPSSPLAGRNPVDFNKASEYEKNKNDRSSSLKNRNPVDFDGCDPHGNPTPGNRNNPLDGRNPRDFDGCDPYGNPINPKGNPLAGRNPIDFDGPRDPYGNPLRSTVTRRSSLEGRNPVDFDMAKNFEDGRGNSKGAPNPKPTRRRSALEGRNPVDFDKALRNEDSNKESFSPRDYIRQTASTSTKPDPPEVQTVYSVQSAGDDDDSKFGQQDTWVEDDEKSTSVESGQMDDDAEQKKLETIPTASRRSSKESGRINTAPLENDFDRKIQVEKLEVANKEASPTKQRRRSTIKKAPRGTREKFSLKTYHIPRSGCPAT